MLNYSSAPFLGMHISEGYLPFNWVIIWSLLAIPFLIWGVKAVCQLSRAKPNIKLVLAMVGAFAFVLSALKMPSLTGTCSHPTGVALGAVLFGPGPMILVGGIVLLFQALLLGHGGISTLGANVFSMAIAGTIIAYLNFKICRKCRLPLTAAIFLSAALSDLGTYCLTAFQLGWAHPEIGVVKFLGVFAITQIPLAIAEGLLSAFAFSLLMEHSRNEMKEIGFEPMLVQSTPLAQTR